MKLKSVILAAVLACLLPVTAFAADEVVRIGVMRFTSKATNVSDLQAEIITDIFTRTMASSKSIALIERERLDMIGREHKLNMSGLVDMGMAVEVGRLAGCQYMIMGSVTALNKGVSGAGFGAFMQGKRESEATIDVRIVDVTTTEIILSLVQTGSSSGQSSAASIYGFTFSEADLSDVDANAVADAAVRLGHKIREELAGEYSQVLQASGNDVSINVGATTGAQKGDLYLVYADGAAVYDIDGTPLGRQKLNIAVIRVNTVSSGFSACDPVKGGGDVALIQRGDKIEPISSKDSTALAKAKDFVKERPTRRAYDETAELLFGGGGSAPVSETLDVDSPVAADPAPAVSPDPAAQPAPVRAPARAASSSSQAFENTSTDPAKVINTYPLNPGERNMRRVAHLNARKFRRVQEIYDAYVELANSYSSDYLAAYQAGETARRMRKNDDAKDWYDKALAINPNYEPAIKARERMK